MEKKFLIIIPVVLVLVAVLVGGVFLLNGSLNNGGVNFSLPEGFSSDGWNQTYEINSGVYEGLTAEYLVLKNEKGYVIHIEKSPAVMTNELVGAFVKPWDMVSQLGKPMDVGKFTLYKISGNESNENYTVESSNVYDGSKVYFHGLYAFKNEDYVFYIYIDSRISNPQEILKEILANN